MSCQTARDERQASLIGPEPLQGVSDDPLSVSVLGRVGESAKSVSGMFQNEAVLSNEMQTIAVCSEEKQCKAKQETE